MSEIIDQISQAHRAVRSGDGDGAGDGVARTVRIRRAYPAPIEDVWDACTTAERIGRWLTPVTGDLRLGGKYQLEGNAGGEILRCEPPRLLRVTWVYGEEATEVEVRLAPGDGAQTMFELEHTGAGDPERWRKYGPGALGVGWDLALLGLYLHLSTGGASRPDDPVAWMMSPEGREYITRSSEAWGEAFRGAGASDAEAASAVAETTAAYAPPPPGGSGA